MPAGTVAAGSDASGPGSPSPGIRKVRTVQGKYLPDVTLNLDCAGKVTSGKSDSTGRFLLVGVPAGHCELEIDGTTAREPGRSYGRFYPGVDLQPGMTNVLPYTIWMTSRMTGRVTRKLTLNRGFVTGSM